MKLITILSLLLLASSLLSAAAVSDEDEQLVEAADIYWLITEGDDGERLAAYLGDRLVDFSPDVDTQLEDAIRLNLPEFFRCLFRHTRFLTHHLYGYNQHLTDYLNLALAHHQPEICDFLLATDFQIEDHEPVFWNQEPFLWTVEELVELAGRHPRFGLYMAPRWTPLSRATSLEAATRMLDFVERLSHDFGYDFPERGCFHPTALLACLVGNGRLADAELAALFGRLLQMGAEASKDIVDLFVAIYPNHVLARNILFGELDIKEPAES